MHETVGYTQACVWTLNDVVICWREKMPVDSPALLSLLGSVRVAGERKPVARHSANTFSKNGKIFACLDVIFVLSFTVSN